MLNYGSLNIDYVYRVPHFVRPGETLSSTLREVFAGGKGANQTTALARAGAEVYHAGKIGKEGKWLKEQLAQDGAHTELIRETKESNGHAMIQVDKTGQNAIILFPGANKQITKEEIDETLTHFQEGDYLLLQNEINHIDYLIKAGSERGLEIFLNPAPMEKGVLNYPLHLVSSLIVNETEAEELTREGEFEDMITSLAALYPETEIILTLGREGCFYCANNERLHVPAKVVKSVDTTAAGDTFIGYYLAARLEEQPIKECLEFATKASALCVSRKGAGESIPYKAEVFS